MNRCHTTDKRYLCPSFPCDGQLNTNSPKISAFLRQRHSSESAVTHVMAPIPRHQKQVKRAKRANEKKAEDKGIDIDAAVQSIVNEKLKDILGECSYSAPSPSVSRSKRLLSERDIDSGSDDEFPLPKQTKSTKQTNKSTKRPALAQTSEPNRPPESKPDYARQVIILEGIDDGLKKHPSRLSEAFLKTKPNVELRSDGLRLTASGDVLVKPKNPKDCNSLLKTDAFPSPCALGNHVKARVPKTQQVTHQVVIKNVDIEVTQEEMDAILTRQELPYKSVKRIHSRQRNAATRMFRLILKDEDTKKKLLRDGINLHMMHYKCVLAIEDTKSFPKIMQCYKCQQIGDHLAGTCKNDQKCVLCSGPHRKAECTASKDNFKCANCHSSHAAWSQECQWLQKAVEQKKTLTIAQVASATVTPTMLQQILQEVKENIVLLITEVVSRSICELVYEIHDKSVSKLGLPLKVASITSVAANAANKLKFGPASTPVEKTSVKDKVMDSCFPKKAPIVPATPTASNSAEAPIMSQTQKGISFHS